MTDKLRFISSLILNIPYWDANMTDRRINPHFPHIVSFFFFFFTNRRRIIGRQTTYHFKPRKRIKDRRTHYISFHPSYWDLRKTDRLTNNALFYPPIWIYATQTEKTTFHFTPYWNLSKTDGLTTFHSTLHIGTQEKQTDKRRFNSSLILEYTQDR